MTTTLDIAICTYLMNETVSTCQQKQKVFLRHGVCPYLSLLMINNFDSQEFHSYMVILFAIDFIVCAINVSIDQK